MKLKSILTAALAMAALSQASAATFVTNAGPLTANGGSGNLVAVAFDLAVGTSINQLGVYAPSGTLASALTVNLWSGGGYEVYSSSSAALATVTIPAGTYTADAHGYVYAAISTISLTASTDYALSVSGYTTDQVGLAPTDSTPVYGNIGTAFGNPAIVDLFYDGVGNPFDAGYTTGVQNNPLYNIASFSEVPEPETYAMLAGLGLVGFGLYRRCRK